MRRTRIKGLANIPQRKKNDDPVKCENISSETKVAIPEDKGLKRSPGTQSILQLERHVIKEPSQEANLTQTTSVNEESKDRPLECDVKGGISILENVVIVTASDNITGSPNINPSQNSVGTPVLQDINNSPDKKSVPLRRRAIKPSVSLRAYIRRDDKEPNIDINKDNSENSKIEQIPEENSIINEEENSNKLKQSENIGENLEISNLSKNQYETYEIYKLKSPINSTNETVKAASPHTNAGSDCESNVHLYSPTKTNRSRIKAIPRIGIRKITFSANDSEDEGKKINSRTRNDSQSSNVSSVTETEPPPTPKTKEFSSVIQRKCKRTDWSRKLSDARREFTRKFMSGKPDHKKLTMIDLIFYNPTTNSMSKENKDARSNIDRSNEDENEEAVDNPEKQTEKSKNDEENNPKMSDEENELPAPQIKIGPAGEIILDEKSLVIENKETKKNRAELEKSKIVDGNLDRPYGVFKKIKRSKDWGHSETLRFYKALSSIGTDFSLMCDLFPNRTRRELKMKFKKEERMNQALIDNALMQPCSFDFEELKREFELVEIERQVLENQKMKDSKLRTTKQIKRSTKLTKIVQEKDEPKVDLAPSDSHMFVRMKDSEETQEKESIVELTTVEKRQRKNGIRYWSHSETSRFYKALSTIGTDFSLMSDLFPSRNQRELKLKFEKEERTNQALVDKALTQPRNFNFEELKKEFVKQELENQKMKDFKLGTMKQFKRTTKLTNKVQEEEEPKVESAHNNSHVFVQMKGSEETETKDSSVEITKVKKRQRKSGMHNINKKMRREKFDVINLSSDCDSENDSDEESEIIWKPTQTRYGRKVKKREIYEPEIPITEDLLISRKIRPAVDNENESQKPGSIMMISSQTPGGQSVMQIFMVTDKKVQYDEKMVDLDYKLEKGHLLPIAMIKTGQSVDDISAEEIVEENNYTIPADPVPENICSHRAESNGLENTNIETSVEGPREEHTRYIYNKKEYKTDNSDGVNSEDSRESSLSHSILKTGPTVVADTPKKKPVENNYQIPADPIIEIIHDNHDQNENLERGVTTEEFCAEIIEDCNGEENIEIDEEVATTR